MSGDVVGRRSRLDAALQRQGQDVILTRSTLGPGGVGIPNSVTCRARVIGYQPKDLVQGSGIVVGDRKVIMSTTQIDAARWPGGSPWKASQGDPRLPTTTDKVTIDGKPCTVIFAFFDDLKVRIEIGVRG